MSGLRVMSFGGNFTSAEEIWGVASPPKGATNFWEVLGYLAGFWNDIFFDYKKKIFHFTLTP